MSNQLGGGDFPLFEASPALVSSGMGGCGDVVVDEALMMGLLLPSPTAGTISPTSGSFSGSNHHYPSSASLHGHQGVSFFPNGLSLHNHSITRPSIFGKSSQVSSASQTPMSAMDTNTSSSPSSPSSAAHVHHSGTSSRTAGANGNVRTAKIKQTCEACVRAKVKCSSGQPTCSRCITRGIPCVYIEAMKRGRKVNGGQKKVVVVEVVNSNGQMKERLHLVKSGASTSSGSTTASGDAASTSASQASPVSEKVVAKSERTTTSSVLKRSLESMVEDDKNKVSTPEGDSMENMAKKRARIDVKSAKGSSSASAVTAAVSSAVSSAASSGSSSGSSSSSEAKVATAAVLDRKHISEAERKIFQSYFVLLKHATSIFPVCPCGGDLPLPQSKLNRFLECTGQIQRYVDIASGSPKGWKEIEGLRTFANFGDVEFQNTPVSGNQFSSSSQSILTQFLTMKFGDSKFSEFIHKQGSDVPYICFDYLAESCISEIPSSKPEDQIPVSVKLNQAFTNNFGYSLMDIKFLQQYLLGGLLPWGGDIIALLSQETDSVIRYVHQFAAKIESTQQKHFGSESSSHHHHHHHHASSSSSQPTSHILKEAKFIIDDLHFQNRFGKSNSITRCEIVFRRLYLQNGALAGSQLHIFFPSQPLSQPTILTTAISAVNKTFLSDGVTPSLSELDDELGDLFCLDPL